MNRGSFSGAAAATVCGGLVLAAVLEILGPGFFVTRWVQLTEVPITDIASSRLLAIAPWLFFQNCLLGGAWMIVFLSHAIEAITRFDVLMAIPNLAASLLGLLPLLLLFMNLDLEPLHVALFHLGAFAALVVGLNRVVKYSWTSLEYYWLVVTPNW